jgi:hypothetical protein
MKTFYLTACLLVLSTFSMIQAAEGSPTPKSSRPVTTTTKNMNPQTIRQMPLLERPNRPGHFIGNTIRGMYGRGTRG